MNKKKSRFTTYEDLLRGYYGYEHPRPETSSPVVVSQSMDNGEVLAQKNTAPDFEEYVVQSSLSDVPFEEYVVPKAPVDEGRSATPVPSYAAPQSFTQAQETAVDLFNPWPENSSPYTTQEAPLTPKAETANPPARPAQPPKAEYAEPAPETSKATASDDDFLADMQAILSGAKSYDPETKTVVGNKNLSEKKKEVLQSVPAHQVADKPLPDGGDGHRIFERIAQSMQYANAYDLGSIDLDKRFADFDNLYDVQKTVVEKRPPTAPPVSVPRKESVVGNEEFIQDLDAIAKGSPQTTVAATPPTAAPAVTAVRTETDEGTRITTIDRTNPAWPPRPSNLRPYTTLEKTQVFGSFPYEPDPSTFNGDGIRVTNDWRSQNIISVPVPQLTGKLMNGRPMTSGYIYFHRLGAEALRNLWAAWEAAGLLDKILTFEGGYAARFIKSTQSRNPRPASNHAWGLAFDVNAPQNPFGRQPALAGQPGSVRELVSLANQHGFFWGGHFRGRPDGMHFELGKIIN